MPTPATSGQHVAVGQKTPALSHLGCWGPLCLADRQAGTGSRTDSCPYPSPCQIVLNYNDKRWQASTATSQNMTNTPLRRANKRRLPHHSVPSRRLRAGYPRPRHGPRGWPTLDPAGWIRVGASGRGLGPHSPQRHGPEPPYSPGAPLITCSFEQSVNTAAHRLRGRAAGRSAAPVSLE